MADKITQYIAENQEPSVSKKLRNVIADAFTAVRSAEANKALATVSLEQLIGDQIIRNGESAESNGSQFNPYDYDSSGDSPASREPAERANFLGVANIGVEDNRPPTKLDFVLAIKNEIEDVIKQVKDLPPSEVAEADEYTDGVEAAPDEDESTFTFE
jgi:hypothetical protein